MTAAPYLVTLALVTLAVIVGSYRTRGARAAAWTALVVAPACALVAWWLRSPHAALEGVFRWRMPWMLALTGVAALFVALRAGHLPRTMAPWRRTIFWALGVTSLFALTLAAAAPEWGHRTDRLTVVFAVDRSRSMDLVASASPRVRHMERAAVTRMRPFDQIARVVFGAEAATEDPARPRNAPASAQEVSVSRDGSDLAAGLRRALAEIGDESTGRVVLVTDGAANRGDTLAAAAAAAAAGVPVDVVPMRSAVRRNLRVESARGPSLADENEAFDLRVVTRSTVAADVDVRVLIDGQVAQRGSARVAAGEDVITLHQTAPAAGLHRYEVELIPRDPSVDQVLEDDRAGLFLRVRGPSSVLVLEGDPGASAPLARALRENGGFRVLERGQNGFPQDLAELASFDLVVLSDVPARALSPDQLEQLRAYVRDLGGGLWLMGGDRSLGPGGYSRTPVEEISPVSFDLRQERRRASLAEVISIDYSGSMTAQVGGFTKIQLANEAAARSAMLLGPGDRLGVAHVDTETRWTVRLGPIQDLQLVATRIRAVTAGGGGIIVPTAIHDAYASLRAETTNLKHLLLFADGDDAEEMPGCAATVAEAYREGITTSVVSLGRGVDTAELERLAREGHGRFYLVEDALRLPTVFAQETILASRASIREERFRVRPLAPDVVTQGVAFGSSPPLRGYVVTIPKPRASVLLTGPEDDPILATWQVGVGHVAAFTSDAKDRWGAEWLNWSGASQLWVALGRSLVRRDDSLVRVEADTTGGVLHVRASANGRDGHADSLRRLTARVTGPDGRARELPLDPTGAGTYSADLALAQPGAWVVSVRDDTMGAIVATTGALLLAGEELRPPTDATLLERVAVITGGRVTYNPADVFDHRVGLHRAYTPLAPWLLLIGLAGLVLSVASRRIGMPESVARWLGKVLPGTEVAPNVVASGARRAAEASLAGGALEALLAKRRPVSAPSLLAPILARLKRAPSDRPDATVPAALTVTFAPPPEAPRAAPSAAGPSQPPSIAAMLARKQKLSERPPPVASVPPPRSLRPPRPSTSPPPAGPHTRSIAPPPGESAVGALLEKRRSRRPPGAE